MSIDLAVSDKLNGTPQVVEDQDGGVSNLALASHATTIGTTEPYEGLSGPASLTVYGGDNIFPFVIQRPTNPDSSRSFIVGTFDGESTKAFEVRVNDDGTFMIKVGGNTALWLDPSGNLTANGTISAKGMQPESSAPEGADLQAVYVDTNTGMLYWD